MDKLITISHAIDIVREAGGCDSEKCKESGRVRCDYDCILWKIIDVLRDADADAVFAAVEARLF